MLIHHLYGFTYMTAFDVMSASIVCLTINVGGHGSLIGRTGGPRVRRFFRGAEDAAPGGGDRMPSTPEVARTPGRRTSGSGPSPQNGGGGGGGGGGKVGAAKRRGGAPDPVPKPKPAQEAIDALGEEPTREENYTEWLEHQKAKWKLGRVGTDG